MVGKAVAPFDSFFPLSDTCTSPPTRYTYDPPIPNGLGRLGTVTDPSGSTTVDVYDVRGRVRAETKTVAADGAVSSATTEFTYDDTAGHLTQLTYPDGEVVTYSYNLAGQVTAAYSQTFNRSYLTALTYDRFGRPRRLSRGNGTVDTATYGDTPASAYRLARLTTELGPTVLLDYGYTYDARGRVTGLADHGPKGTGSVMDNTAAFTYDGLGRLVAAIGSPLGVLTYDSDAWGNLRVKDNVALAYDDPLRPHRLTAVGGSRTQLSHDANGNRQGKPPGGQGMPPGGTPTAHAYTYDAEDRLTRIATGSSQVDFLYDHTGRRVAKLSDGPDAGTTPEAVTVYYSDLLERTGDWLTKYYYAGGRLIATRREENRTFARGGPPAVEVARTALGRPALILLVRPDRQRAAAAATVGLGVFLLLLPARRRRRVAGLVLRHGQVTGVTLAFTLSTLPWPLAVRPAQAQCPAPAAPVFHYHLDHLGSTQLITDDYGAPVEYLRYYPYGNLRGRFTATGAPISPPNEVHRREFTGYETEFLSALQYAGARFYDPALGLFLTHDPARQFPNPYSYGGGDPLNGTDPNGESFLGIDLLILVLVSTAIGFATASIQAALSGASPLQALKAGLISGAIGGAVAAAGLGVLTVINHVAGAGAAYAFAAALTAYGGYSTVEGFRSGNYVSAGVGAAFLALGLYGLTEGPEALGKRLGGEGKVAQGGNGAAGKQVAGLESDAQVPDVTVEPGLQPGDRSPGMILGERVRGAQVRAMIAKYGGNIDAAASEFGVDADLIRGIIFEEQTHLLPGEGLAERYGIGRTVGLGQVSEGLHGFTRAQLLDPATNIRAIGTHLSHLQGQPLISPRAPLASLATSYNCGSCTAITAYGRRVVFYRSQFLGGP